MKIRGLMLCIFLLPIMVLAGGCCDRTQLGGSCDVDSDCCSEQCGDDGRCCLGDGTRPSSELSTDCCSGNINEDTGRCCAGNGDSPSSELSTDCCSGNINHNTGICCAGVGDSALRASDCCEGLIYTISGTCRQPTPEEACINRGCVWTESSVAGGGECTNCPPPIPDIEEPEECLECQLEEPLPGVVASSGCSDPNYKWLLKAYDIHCDYPEYPYDPSLYECPGDRIISFWASDDAAAQECVNRFMRQLGCEWYPGECPYDMGCGMTCIAERIW